MSQPIPPSLENLSYLGLNFDKLNDNAQMLLVHFFQIINQAEDPDYVLVNQLADQIVELDKIKNADPVISLLDFYSKNINSIRSWYNVKFLR